MLPDVVAVALFAIISFVYFYPANVEGLVLGQHDHAAGIGAGQEAKEYMERTGERTRWTNSLFGGMPTYQMSPSYESTNVLSWVERAYRLFIPGYTVSQRVRVSDETKRVLMIRCKNITE